MTNRTNNRKSRKPKLTNKASSHFRPFPDSMRVAIRYSTRINFSASAFSVYNVGMSSMQTFQGFYRDQLLALYKNYVVMGFTVNYKIINTDVVGAQAELLFFDCPQSVTSGITFANALEWPGVQKQLISSTGNNMSIQKTMHYSLATMYKKDISVDSDFWGTASAAPAFSDLQDHCLGIYSLDGTSTVKCLVDREYIFHVKFFRRVNPGNSFTSSIGDITAVFPEKKPPKVKKAVKHIVSSDTE